MYIANFEKAIEHKTDQIINKIKTTIQHDDFYCEITDLCPYFLKLTYPPTLQRQSYPKIYQTCSIIKIKEQKNQRLFLT